MLPLPALVAVRLVHVAAVGLVNIVLEKLAFTSHRPAVDDQRTDLAKPLPEKLTVDTVHVAPPSELIPLYPPGFPLPEHSIRASEPLYAKQLDVRLTPPPE